MVSVAALGTTMMMIARTGAKMMIRDKKTIHRGDSMIIDYKEIKLEKFDNEASAFEIAEILKEHLPLIKSAKVFKNLDYARYKIDLVFTKPALNNVGHKIEGINVNLSSLSTVTNTDKSLIWEEITPKD